MWAWRPTQPPANLDVQSLARWVMDEFNHIAAAGDSVVYMGFAVLHEAPAKPKEGMVAFADGLNWNPGLGRGLYVYTGGGWLQL